MLLSKLLGPFLKKLLNQAMCILENQLKLMKLYQTFTGIRSMR